MCVIAVKKKGIPVPSDGTLRKCFEANPHGAGMMYLTKRGVSVSTATTLTSTLFSLTTFFRHQGGEVQLAVLPKNPVSQRKENSHAENSA